MSFTWAWALCLAWVLRALVPMGYMPNLAGAADGLPLVVLCGAPAQTSHEPIQGDPADHFDANHCPYSLISFHGGGVPLPSGAPVIPAVLLGVILTLVHPDGPPPAAHPYGAPLGSRAPPQI
ncbi:DUF2946 family protein [Castellaniella sp.]|uniref:DUF2946 family protein n=1 Tax=Castellaniella sp. TaxID=1955812 RepID=UPI002AFDE8F4|nr:DUF2946 family protein [Castellaniella sp.]